MIGYFVDKDGWNIDTVDDSQLPIFNSPRKKINLLASYDRKKMIEYVQSFRTSIIPLLTYLNKCKYPTPKGSIITYRGNLKDIMQAPFAKYPKVEICSAGLNAGCIVLDKADEPKLYENVLRGIHYNEEFKRKCVTNYNPDLYRVHRIQISGKTFIIAQLIDAVDANGDPIKIKVAPQAEYDLNLNIQRALDLWTQCYAGGVKTIIVGYYDISGVVVKVKKYNISQLEQILADRNISTKKCIRTLEEFANKTAQYIVDEEEYYTIGHKNGTVVIDPD